MASKKATCYIFNVNHSMSLFPDNAFEKSLQTITSSIEDRIFAGRKTDLVSVILCGTPETRNALAEETPGQYQNITTMTPLAMPAVQLLKDLSNLTTEEATERPADVLDALIVSIAMIASHCKKLKYIKRIVIFTDNQSKIDWLDLPAVAEMLKNNQIEVTLVGVDFEEFQSPSCTDEVKTNYKQWQNLIKTGHEGDIASLEEAYAQTQSIYIKEVNPRPSYRGYLYLGSPTYNSNFLPISIHTYIRTKATTLPTVKKISGLSKGPTRKVEMVTKYLMPDNEGTTEESPELEVTKENIQKGYKFGKSVVLISSEELAMSKLITKKEMSILRFVNAEEVPRYHLYSNVFVLTAGSFRTEQSAVALATLAEAMYETGRYALVRFVPNDGAAPRIGILQPELDDICPVLQYFDVPFAEDIRNYKFKSTPAQCNLDQEDLDLMGDLVDSMSLDRLGPDFLAPETNFNPIDWKVKTVIKRRALNPSAPIPELGKKFDDQIRVHSIIVDRVGDLGPKIAKKFKVTKVTSKGKRTFAPVTDFDDKAPITDLLDSASSDARNTTNTDIDTMITQIRGEPTIGLSTPVEDYNAMLSRTYEDEDMVDKADTLMHQVIFKLLNLSFGNQHYQKVFNCLVTLRKTCAAEDDALRYNTIIKELKSWCNLSTPGTPRRQMWEMVKEADLGLITNEECQDVDTRDVTKQDAEKFWNETEDDAPAAVDVDMERFDADDLDDLF